MKLFFLFSLTAMAVFASVPEPIIEYKNTYNGYATVAGKLSTKPLAPVGISLENGGLRYSTISDADGRWSIVFRLRSTKLEIEAWSMGDANERFRIEANIP